MAQPPSSRSSSTEPVAALRAAGWRREVSKIRIASPPIPVGSTWPTVWAT